MSLINQMLKDLEQRGAESSNVAKSPSIGISPTKPLASSFPVIKIGLLLILLVGVVYSWLHSSSKLNTEADQQLTPQIAAIEPKSQTVTENASNSAAQTSKSDSTEPLFESGLKNRSSNHQVEAPKQENEKKSTHAPAKTAVTKSVEVKLDEKQSEPSAQTATNNSNESEKIAGRKQTVFRVSTKLSSENLSANKEVSNKETGVKETLAKDNVGKEISNAQKSKNSYSQAIANLKQGRVSEAQTNLNLALEANPANHEARQTLAGLLLDNKRIEEAKATLIAGLEITPEQSDFRIALARIQVEFGEKSNALSTLEQGLTYSHDNANYQSFLATLLQRAGRHDEAIEHYKSAIALGTVTPSTLVGAGISSQAVGQLDNAKDFFTNAQSNTSLTPELSAFVEQRLKQINQQLRN